MPSTWKLAVWLGVIAIAAELASVATMFMMTNIYTAITSDNRHQFWRSIAIASGLVTLQSILHSYKTYLADRCSIFWRKNLVDHFHAQVVSTYDSDLPNIDQRITQDADLLSSKLASLIEKSIALPALMIFFSVYLVFSFGILTMLGCYAYAALGAYLCSFLAKFVVELVYKQGQYEGDFRLLHSHFMTNVSLIKLLSGGAAEQSNMKRAFSLLVWNKQSTILRTYYLNICTNWFAYSGAIFSYFMIGACLLYPNPLSSHPFFAFLQPLSSGTEWTSEERIVLLSRGSYACMNLIYALTNALNVYSLYATYKGYVQRIQDLSPKLNILALLLCNYSQQHDLQPPTCWCSCPRLGLGFFHLFSSQPRYHSASTEDPLDGGDGDNSLEVQLLPHPSSSSSIAREPSLQQRNIHKPPPENTILQLSHCSLTIASSSGLVRKLVTDLSLEVQYGMRLLITGPNGVGKSQLLHHLSHLLRRSPHSPHAHSLPSASGLASPLTEKILATQESEWTDPHLLPEEVYLCPQTPYHQLTETVWEYLYYPQGVDLFAVVSLEHQTALYHALEHCRMLHRFLVMKKDEGKGERRAGGGERGMEAMKWVILCMQNTQMASLSMGERQILSIVRFLFRILRRPGSLGMAKRLALLDEATSAVDEENEHALYQALSLHCSTFISVGHRSTIRDFHTHHLHILFDGSYTFSSISPA